MKFEEVIFTQKAYHHKPTFLPTRATESEIAQMDITGFQKVEVPE